MHISYQWLQDFLKIPAKVGAAEVAERLTAHTVEVEGIAQQADSLNQVVVGLVLSVEKHPNADRLRLALVDTGTAKQRVVCGAPNLAAGQKVALALPGAILPGGFEIKESVIRGEISQGMICAEDELGLGEGHEGIMVLPANAKTGWPLAKYLKAEDTILEIDNKSLSNRPDLLGHYGIAREISALLDLKLKPYEKLLSSSDIFPASGDGLAVKIEDASACPRYSALKIEGVEVKESPSWLKARLAAVGQKPVNNIVDLTNYVMFDCGQPLHAFSAAGIKKIVVRSASEDEVIETLDGKERHLKPGDLLITDGQKPLALAGIIGGQESGVNEKTTSIILEAANFDASTIRRTSQRLGLRTEASTRFEKSLDPTLPALAVRRFMKLLSEVCPAAKVAGPLTEVVGQEMTALVIDLDLAWLDRKIGQPIPRDTVIGILIKLGFQISNKKAAVLKVTVPTWRQAKDISRAEDLVEEVLRLYGYDEIAPYLPQQTLSLPPANPERRLERRVKQLLAWKYSLSESYNYSFVGEEQLKKMGIDFSLHLRLVNPLSEIQNLLRQSLAAGLAGNIKTNQHRAGDFGFFEVGATYFNAPGTFPKEPGNEEMLPYQEKRLGLALARESSDPFSYLKGILNDLFITLAGPAAAASFTEWENRPGWPDANRSALVSVFGKEVGYIAAVGPETVAALNLKKPAAIAEINFDRLAVLLNGSASRSYQEPAKYPAVTRDLAFVMDEEIRYNDLIQEMSNFHPLIRSVKLFDVYSGGVLSRGQKSLAFHLDYLSAERTLTAAEVDAVERSLVSHIESKFDAKRREV